MLNYVDFLSKYAALALLQHKDREMGELSKIFRESGIETLDYLKESYVFGALCEMVKDGWVEMYTKVGENNIKHTYYHLTALGYHYAGPYYADLLDIFKRFEGFHEEPHYR